MSQSRRMKGAHEGEKRNAYGVLAGKPDGKEDPHIGG
jgi:hypothetical protein